MLHGKNYIQIFDQGKDARCSSVSTKALRSILHLEQPSEVEILKDGLTPSVYHRRYNLLLHNPVPQPCPR